MEVYTERAFLNSLYGDDLSSISIYVSEVEDCSSFYVNGRLNISDDKDAISIYLDFSTEESFKNSIKTLDTILELTSRLKQKVIDAAAEAKRRREDIERRKLGETYHVKLDGGDFVLEKAYEDNFKEG